MIGLLVSLIVIGLLLYAASIIPMPPWLHTVINVIGAIFVILTLVNAFSGYHLAPYGYVR